MKDSPTIIKNRKLSPTQDFQLLRQWGITRIEELGSQLWTDYNIHDPGITILEVLCYALTDLGYRTDFPIEDLLTHPIDQPSKDFFTAAEILTCNPVTVIDLRKLIIDQVGIQNGWLSNRYNPDSRRDIPLPDQEKGKPTFYYQCNENNRSYDIKFQADTGYESKILNGLYDVLLQLEEDAEFGDLNSNVIPWVVKNSLGQTKNVKVVLPPLEVQFPPWDYPIAQVLDYNTLTSATVTNYQNINGEITFDLQLNLTTTDATQNLTISLEGIELLIERKETVVINEAQIIATFETVDQNSFAFRLFKRWQMIMERIKRVFCVLHQHRNLDEDYVKFRLVPTQEIAICADIEVTADSDLEEILAKIYSEIDLFLAPPVRFYSLNEMQAKGKSTEEIFESVILDHGFIETEELAKSELKSEINVSDLYQIIMEIDGVIAVKNLLITNYFNGVAQTDGEPWCLRLGDSYNLNLYLDKSRVLFYKNNLPFKADLDQVKRLVQTLKATKQKPKLIRSEQDLPIPSGNYRELSQYISIQTEFPLVYGIGPEGLSTTATESRKAQAKQLKAFLMFFDQLLANYLAQLDYVKNLLSINPSLNIEHTYAVQPLYKGIGESDQDDFPKVANLFKPFVDDVKNNADPAIANADLDNLKFLQNQWNTWRNDSNNKYLKDLQKFSESETLFAQRRNRFLDHLIARFGESFTDYAILMYDLEGKRKGNTQLIEDKESFLAKYPEISRDRGKAFQYQCYKWETSDPWQANNVSGLKKRLCALLGIDNYQRRHLSYTESDIEDDFTITGSPDNFGFELSIDGEVVLQSLRNYATEAEAMNGIKMVINGAISSENYVIRPVTGGFELDLWYGDRCIPATEILNYFSVIENSGNYDFELSINSTVVLRNVNTVDSEVEAITLIRSVIENGKDIGKYQIHQMGEADSFDFDLYDGNGVKIATHGNTFATKPEAETQIQAIIEFLKANFFRLATHGNVLASKTNAKEKIKVISNYLEDKYFREGMHIFEHILLRPIREQTISDSDIEEGYFPECKLEENCDCPLKDYYSFRISVILPYWPIRFRNMEFREYVEETIHRETPAHILAKICWLDLGQMNELEDCYQQWLQTVNPNSDSQKISIPDREELSTQITALIKKLNTLTTVYPEGVLHDCQDPETNQNIIILNKTQLGTFKEIEDDTTE